MVGTVHTVTPERSTSLIAARSETGLPVERRAMFVLRFLFSHGIEYEVKFLAIGPNCL